MIITINMPGVDMPDQTIEAEHILLLAENNESARIKFTGDTTDDNLGQQLAGVFLALKEGRPGALWAAASYILSPGFRRRYHGRD